jgi:hypothetical protein
MGPGQDSNVCRPQCHRRRGAGAPYVLGGDAFDFAPAGTSLQLAVCEAMGHRTAAGITADLAVAACRNAHRQGAALTIGSGQRRGAGTQAGVCPGDRAPFPGGGAGGSFLQ